MTDHDDQISNNRRRLFKALSAAPVVMTLRPGEVLANNSAFQCAEKIADPAQLPNLEQYGPVTTPGFLSVELEYFALGTVDPACVLKALSGSTVVPIEGVLYEISNPGVAISNGFEYTKGAPLGTGTLDLLNNGGNVCQTITAQVGNFALLDYADGFEGVPFPKSVPSTPGLQGMTGTCLCSVNPDATYCTVLNSG